MRRAKHFNGSLPAEEDGALATPQASANLGKKLEKHTLAPPCAKPVTGLPKHAVFHNPIPPAELLPGGRSGNIVEAACPETCCQAACFYNYSILSHIVR